MAQPALIHKAGMQRREPEQVDGIAGYSTQEIYAELLQRLDPDPLRDGLLKTPERVEKSMAFLTNGYQEDPTKILRGALFDVEYDEMVIVKDIEMFSLCEHHMLPFFGRVHVAYIPNGKVIGLSKIPRLIEHDDARGGEAEFVHGDLGDAGSVQQAKHADGVSFAGPGAGPGSFLRSLQEARSGDRIPCLARRPSAT